MVPLHQLFESGLYFGTGGCDFKPQSAQSLSLDVPDGTLFCRTGCAGRLLGKKIKGVRPGRPPGHGGAIGPALLGGTGSSLVHLPGRPVAGEGILLVGSDVLITHALEIIIFVIVFADVLETVVPILLLGATPFGRAMAARLFAARPLASRRVGFLRAVLRRLDADLIENG